MGDRALFRIHNGSEIGPVVYVHWIGGASRARELLESLRIRMQGREGDVEYATARLVGLAHESIEGNLSLGVWSEGADYKAERERWQRVEDTVYGKHYVESHGDFGIAFVDCRTWDVECWGGYGLSGRGYKPRVHSLAPKIPAGKGKGKVTL